MAGKVLMLGAGADGQTHVETYGASEGSQLDAPESGRDQPAGGVHALRRGMAEDADGGDAWRMDEGCSGVGGVVGLKVEGVVLRGPRQPAYFRILPHISAYFRILQHISAYFRRFPHISVYFRIFPHTTAYFCIMPQNFACFGIFPHITRTFPHIPAPFRVFFRIFFFRASPP